MAANGDQSQSQMSYNAHAIVGQDHRPERRQILKARTDKQDCQPGDCSAQSDADSPGLHRLLQLEDSWVPLSGTFGAVVSSPRPLRSARNTHALAAPVACRANPALDLPRIDF